jgi:hypothetical protein
MRAEKLGIALQRFRKYNSSSRGGTAGFRAEKRWRFSVFSAAGQTFVVRGFLVRSFSIDFSAVSVEARFTGWIVSRDRIIGTAS